MIENDSGRNPPQIKEIDFNEQESYFKKEKSSYDPHYLERREMMERDSPDLYEKSIDVPPAPHFEFSKLSGVETGSDAFT